MEREERLEAISYAEREVLEDLADRVLEDLDVEVSRGPSVGLLMLRGEEPSDRLQFNFSEVTVSEAEVTAGGQRGYAMVLGRQPEKALAGAILDVALQLAHSTSDEIEAALQAALSAESVRRQRAVRAVAGTRVQFEEMKP
ncbi:MAG TPA: phosphonate C-P lyase system protein PhnG [Dehalococcoidia bacterium]|jgi:alpha-D-ribose 1-methylphosphonate 5-triphosphate synthase subunit PhnG|nr:phosphonate C-P lyase system protein PhnG [Dehalococcoidia bacterium]